jgi:hypothetical protein
VRRLLAVFAVLCAVAGTTGAVGMSSAAAVAAVPADTTLYFHSASGAYSSDATTASTTGFVAPAGATLTTAPPAAGDTTDATAAYQGPATAGSSKYPTFGIPAGLNGTVTNVCLDVWVSNTAGPFPGAIDVNTSWRNGAQRNPTAETSNSTLSGTGYANDGTPRHLTGLVIVGDTSPAPIDLTTFKNFLVSSYVDTDPGFTLYYDSANHPSSIRLNVSDPTTCGVSLPTTSTVAPDSPGALGAGTPAYTTYVPNATQVYDASSVVNQAYFAGAGADNCPRLGCDAGEPSIGADWSTGDVLYTSGVHVLRVNGFDGSGQATWADVSALVPAQQTADPIGFTDRTTNRTWDVQLVGTTSEYAISDDSGHHWDRQGVFGTVSGDDHEAVASGPYAPGSSALPATSYAHAVYYCSQETVSFCERSDDGGNNFGPANTPFGSNGLDCGGLHGHVKVGPDGTAYLPNGACGANFDQVGVAYTRDGGATWNENILDSASSIESDPSVAVDDAGNAYLGWADTTDTNGGSRPFIAVSRDHGAHFVDRHDVGSTLGIKNVQFASLTAGGPGRAAYAFLGTTTPGNDQVAGFKGVWYLYVSTTTDGGATWTTVKADPDPVQRGCIDMGGFNPVGASPNCRNMYDFMDVTTDRLGRVVVAYADGCIKQCDDLTKAVPASASGDFRAAQATIVRQESGARLFATPQVSQPDVVRPTVTVAGTAMHVAWTPPADNGRPITAYRVYRGRCDDATTNQAPSTSQLVATLPAAARSWDDTAANATAPCYEVSAANGAPGRPNGEGEHFLQAAATDSPVVPEVPLAALLPLAAAGALGLGYALRRRTSA